MFRKLAAALVVAAALTVANSNDAAAHYPAFYPYSYSPSWSTWTPSPSWSSYRLRYRFYSSYPDLLSYRLRYADGFGFGFRDLDDYNDDAERALLKRAVIALILRELAEQDGI